MDDWFRKTGLRVLTYLPVSDEMLQSILKTGINFTLNPDDNMTSAVLLRCVNGDMREFSFDDLKALDPRYPDAIKEALEHQLVRMDKEQQHITKGQPFTVDLYQATHYAETKGLFAKSREPGYDSRDMKQNATTYNDGQILRDAIRALGHVNVDWTSNTVSIDDAFDFEGPYTGVRDNLRAAVAYADIGKYEASHNQLGSIFCREGENNARTETSVPVKFSFSFDDLSDEAKRALASMEERSHSTPIAPTGQHVLSQNDRVLQK